MHTSFGMATTEEDQEEMSEPNTITITQTITGVLNGYPCDVPPGTYTVHAKNLTHAILGTLRGGRIRVRLEDIG